MISPSNDPLPSLFGQSTRLAVAISLERLNGAALDALLRYGIKAGQQRTGEAQLLADLGLLCQTRSKILYRSVLCDRTRHYYNADRKRTAHILAHRLLSVRGWRRKYPKLLRRD